MKDCFCTLLKASIIYLTALLTLVSCEKEELPSEESDKVIIDRIINHFQDISTHLYSDWEGTGENLYQRNARWKDGGLNGTNKIDVFFHESFTNVSKKNGLIEFLETLDSNITDENIKFNIVTSIDSADITIFFGKDERDQVYGESADNGFLGAAIWDTENMRNIQNPDVTKIVHGNLWINIWDHKLLKHEFLHVLGFHHTNLNGIMNHYVNNMRELKDLDVKVINLLYHNGDYGVESVPEFVEGVDDINDTLPPNIVSKEEWDEHIDNLIYILENRYGLSYD